MASESSGSSEPLVIPTDRDFLRPHIHALGTEKEEERFSTKDDIVGPTVATWRCNLVASSQRRNLLFVAYGCDVHVWIPDGPCQLLGSQAKMVIKPVMKTPLADGYIDRTTPHTINAILVDDLGRDEILLLATDSGNVCGYHVEAIYSAIERCTKSGYKRPFDGTEVNAFFVENVGMSAWGLATHKYARLIAVSANTGQITVYAFALVDHAADSDDFVESSETLTLTADQNWVAVDSRKQLKELQKHMPRNHRTRNLRLTYRGHFDNIPCVSFANFDLDADGLWMVSTDISNRVILWRIWDDLWPRRVYYPGHPMNNPPQRGWNVIPLDPRTFKQHPSREEACGCEPKSLRIGQRTVLDVSTAIEEIPDSSQVFVFGFDKGETATPKFLPDDLVTPGCCIDGGLPYCSTDTTQDDTPQTVGLAVDDESRKRSRSSSPNSDKDEGENPPSQRVRSKRRVSSLFDEEYDHYRMATRLHPDYTSEEGSETDLNVLRHKPVHPRYPNFFPVIHFSEQNVSLAPYPMDSEYHLLCRTPLFQRFSFNVEISSACDRFNMVKYVPELGLVIAASQKGRVAIISLTWQEEIGYGFRVDWIVPFFTQERNDERPMIPLLGLAVSPMPGFEIPQDVPCIPRGADPDDWLLFNYRILNPENNESSSAGASPSPSRPTSPPNEQPESQPSSKPEQQSHTSSRSGSTHESFEEHPSSDEEGSGDSADSADERHTVPELHAQASRVYRPHERWHGWHPSRHYRLLLLFCDHTVMSYEFWHDWKR